MRTGWGLAIAGAAALTTGLVACFDLFHSTEDFRSACELDARTEGCVTDASATNAADAGESDFCAWSPSVVRPRARRACAWLGACETPMGRNAFGPCMVEALLAYDCGANPDHRAKAKSHELWDCLWRANSCAAVDACIFPKGPQSCRSVGDYMACGTAANATVNNLDVRVECTYDGGAYPNARGENCALWGRTCASSGGLAACAGSRTAGLTCTQPGCYGASTSQLHWCDADGRDIGIACASNGAQRCGAYSDDAGVEWVACGAESDAAPCVAAASATCVSGVATSCPSGVPETIDCAKILDSPSACVAGPLVPPFDWTSACALPAPQCTEDSCRGNALTGCARGAAFALDCGQVGLGACAMATTMGASPHAACTPP